MRFIEYLDKVDCLGARGSEGGRWVVLRKILFKTHEQNELKLKNVTDWYYTYHPFVFNDWRIVKIISHLTVLDWRFELNILVVAKEVLQRRGPGRGRGGRGGRWTRGRGDNSLSLIIDNICTAFKEEILSLDQRSIDAFSIRSKFLNGGKEEMF